MTLGSAFPPLALAPPIVVEPSKDDLLALRLELVLTALDTLSDSLRDLPAPQVFIDAPDLSAIVQAVNGLKPGVDADQIAQAVVHAIAPSAAPEKPAWEGELVEQLKKLDFRLKGVGGSSGGGLVSDISDRATRSLGVVSVENTPVLGGPTVCTTTAATTLATPSAGRRLRVKWLGLSTPENNSAPTTVTFFLGATPIYEWSMGAPGAFAHSTQREGATDDTLTLVMSAAQTVIANVDYEEL